MEYKTEAQLQFLFAKGDDKMRCCCGKIMAKQNFRTHKLNMYHITHRTDHNESYLPTPVYSRQMILKV